MLLELSVLSYHRLSPRQVAVKRFDTSGGTLGRSEHADWYLPDPERVVSGVHALISSDKGQFSVMDKSTNGLFVNRAIEPLGQGNRHILQHGDMLFMGDYEIQVAIIDALPEGENTCSNVLCGNDDVSKIITRPDTAAHCSDSGLAISEIGRTNVTTNVTNNVTTNLDLELPSSHHLNQTPSLDEHFLAPAALIPDDWASGWRQHQDITDEPASGGTSALSPSLISAVSTGDNASTKQSIHNTHQDCLRAFLKGLGVAQENQQAIDSVQWWEQLGQVMQESMQGIIAVMRERSNVKSTFRVNQTTFQQRENNPLKFSANFNDAFHNLFNRPGASFMPARQAVAEAFTDISRHEAAIIAGANGAVTGILAELAPDKIAASDFSSSFVDRVNPAQRQARLWARYKVLHKELATQINSKDNKGVNDDFIMAYEAYLRSQ